MTDSDSDSSNHDSSDDGPVSSLEMDIVQLAKHLESSSDSESDGDQSNNENKSTLCMFSLDTKGSTSTSRLPQREHMNDTITDDSDDDEYTVLNKPQQKRFAPSTKLEPGVSFKEEVYTKPSITLGGGGEASSSAELSSKKQNDIMKASVLSTDIEQKHTLPPYHESLHAMRKQRQKEKANSKGKNWFNMQAPEMTEEQKNDLKVLQMRHVLDPKAFYKRNDLKDLPKFFQMGKVVETAADFYSSRIPKKQRKQTLVDELLADAKFRQYNKKKYTEAVHSKSIPRGKIKMAKRLKKKKR